MRIDRLGHVNIRTPLFEETLDFYERALGLRRGPAVSANDRPQNMWLYDEAGHALVHVNGPVAGEAVHPAGAVSRLDHFAFDCSGLARAIQRLEAEGVPFQRLWLAARGMTQLNIHDPNGIKVELTFRE